MSQSSLSNYINQTNGKYDLRADVQKVSKITIHSSLCVISNFDQYLAQLSSSSNYSFHYGILNDGKIGSFIDEAFKAWGTGNSSNDNISIQIIVSNSENGQPYRVSAQATASLLKLCEDICRRHQISQLYFTGQPNTSNVTLHRWFDSSSMCPGTYLAAFIPQLCRVVNSNLQKPATYDYDAYASSVYNGTASYNLSNGKASTPLSLDQIDPSFIRPYVIQLNRDTITPDMNKLKKKGLTGVIIEAGRLYDDSGLAVRDPVNPNLNKQVKVARDSGMEIGLIILSKAKQAWQAKHEVATLRSAIQGTNPFLGVWVDRSIPCNRSANNAILAQFQYSLSSLGFSNRIGIKVPKGTLQFDWNNFSSDWALWMAKDVGNLSEIDKILYPSFFKLGG